MKEVAFNKPVLCMSMSEFVFKNDFVGTINIKFFRYKKNKW